MTWYFFAVCFVLFLVIGIVLDFTKDWSGTIYYSAKEAKKKKQWAHFVCYIIALFFLGISIMKLVG